MELDHKLPLVSIITVVFNGFKTLEQTILSVLNQTYSNIEYIIIDGGSTDGSLDIIKMYEDKFVYWISEPDKGIYDAMNKGIKIARGELIGMINSDDWFEPDAISLVVNAYLKFPNKSIFHGDRNDVNSDGTRSLRKFNSSKFKFVYYGMTYYHPSMFVKKEIYDKGLYKIQLKSLADYEFTLRNYLSNSNSFYYLDTCYVNYRLDGFSSKFPLKRALLEGFAARKEASLNFGSNLVSLVFRFLIVIKAKIF